VDTSAVSFAAESSALSRSTSRRCRADAYAASSFSALIRSSLVSLTLPSASTNTVSARPLEFTCTLPVSAKIVLLHLPFGYMRHIPGFGRV